jgi:ADP-ribose pyrophosphatase YjhB (NUDIX family)
MKKGWLPEPRWHEIQRQVPITCLDLLLTRRSRVGIFAVGLIYRETPHQGRRWCLIGGRMLLNEAFQAGAERQVRETLGQRNGVMLGQSPQPLLVTEYFSVERPRALFDPRQHAVAMVFSGRLRGKTVRPQGEALDFRWFRMDDLPRQAEFGFGQHKVVAECLRRLNVS